MTNDLTNSHSNNSNRNTTDSFASDRTWLDYLWIIREHWIVALIVALAISSFVAYQKFQAVPLYKASAILLFEVQRDRVINIQEVVDTSLGRTGGIMLKNHLTDLRSNSFRGRIVDSLSPEERELITKDYRDPESDAEPNIHGIIAGANKIAILGGNVFNFEFHHRNPQAAALLANRYSEEFNDFLYERARKTNDAALRFLRSQSEELKLKVERSELAVQRYRQERNLVSLEESQNLIVTRMKDLSGNLNNAKVELLNISATLEQIEGANGDLDQLTKLPSLNSMGTFPQKFEERTNLLAQRKILSLRYGPRHPKMIENESSLETLEANIIASLEKNVSDLQQRRNGVTTQVRTLEEALAKAEQESLELDQIAIEYNVLRRKLDSDQRLFTQVHQRLNETILASQLSSTNLRIVDRAWPAGEPFTPDTGKIYTLTAFLFLFLFGGVPYGIHYLNLNLKTAADIEQQLKIPFLGEIRKFPRNSTNLHRLVMTQADPQASELFRQIHSQILLKNKQLMPGHTFVVTSALPREGKSFFSMNLAASFGRHHYRTLLMDCDFRRPTIGSSMVDELKELISQDTTSEDPLHLTDQFHVLPCINSTVEATELIESAGFRDTIARFQQEYDIVIIDTPPSGLFPDAGLIGNYAHSFLFLTQLNKHRKKTLKAILNRLAQSRAEILGVVVNMVSRGKARNLGTYRYVDYSKYKSYYPHKATTKT